MLTPGLMISEDDSINYLIFCRICKKFSVCLCFLDVAYLKQSGSLQMRRVNVPELDQRFADLAQTFNQHQECFERMVKGIRNLQKEYDCTRCDHMSLSECVGKIMKEWGE